MNNLPEIHEFLLCDTPAEWIESALQQQDLMLIDHANCEKKAASTALTMINRYSEKLELLDKMSRLAREELRHFEQVLAIMKKRNIVYNRISSSRYASELHQYVSKKEPHRLYDSLIIGAFIEARSCERFEKIAPYLDTDLKKFYTSLLKSEMRHFQDYLKLAYLYANDDEYIKEKINYFAKKEQNLILSSDTEFRFHSGIAS